MRSWQPLFLNTVLILVAAAAPARAQGFSINRFDVSERGSEWFVGESLDLRGSGRGALGLVLDYARKPLVLYDLQGNEHDVIVSDQLFAHLGGSLVLFERLRLSANLPLALVNQGQSAMTGGTTIAPTTGTRLGDLRLGVDLRLLGEYGDAFTLAFGAQLYLPTGSRAAFTGDGAVQLMPRLLAAGEIASFAYSVRAGLRYRAQDEQLANVQTGSEVFFAASAGLLFADHKLLIGPELWGSTVIAHGGAFREATTPFEALIGGHYSFGDFRAGLGAGPGLTRGLGAPAARVVASFEWAPGIETDRDHDGILDKDDACPDVPGVPSVDPKKNGCPLPKDRDHDGIIDPEDACPDEPGVRSDDPKKNGCPLPKDRDRDGIIDPEDACPDVPGEPNEDPAKNGCPPPKDSDGDHIIDPEDACPYEPGPSDPDPKKNGCPRARVVQGEIKILDRVEFAFNSAKLLPMSDQILSAVMRVLEKHPEITKVSVEGHTDNVGGAAYNKKLSSKRAESVVSWLVQHGIDPARLTSEGFGLERPLDSNDTDEGRQRNRRVEFHILAQSHTSDADGDPSGETDNNTDASDDEGEKE